jgi:hypothetical protein
MGLLLCNALFLGMLLLLSLLLLCSSALRFSLLPFAAAVLIFPAVQCRLRRSSASLPHCRRVYATTVAVPVFAATCCGAKFANRWRVPSLPPFTSATIWRKFANLATNHLPSLSTYLYLFGFTLHSELCTLHFLFYSRCRTNRITTRINSSTPVNGTACPVKGVSKTRIAVTGCSSRSNQVSDIECSCSIHKLKT